MSRNHENIVWQSPNGTWNRGFHPIDYYECGQSDDCEEAPEHEWCAEFDHDSFEWVSGGHATRDQAYASWDGANPGGSSESHYDPNDAESRKWTAHYEDMAAVLCEAEAARDRPRGWGYYSAYRGPARRRTLAAIARQRNALERDAYSHKLGGYANLPDERIKPLTAQITERLKTATDEEKRAYLGIQQRRRDGLQEMLDKHRERRAEQARANSRYNWGYSYNPDAARRQRLLNEAEEATEKHIAAIDVTRAKQEAEFFPPAPAKKAPAPKKSSPAKPAKKAAPRKAPAKTTASTTRGKSTPQSNAGSFKAHTTAEADVDLTSTPAVADPWGDIPMH